MLKLLHFTKSLLNNVNLLKQPIQIAAAHLPNTRLAATSALSHENRLSSVALDNLNKTIEKSELGRLFAVIQLCGKQFKITSGDVIVVEGYWPPGAGDKIKLEKVLLVGGNDFSVIGKPLVNPNLVNIEATVIEKTLSHTRTHFKKKRRKQYLRINFQRNQNTMLMINSIDLVNKI